MDAPENVDECVRQHKSCGAQSEEEETPSGKTLHFDLATVGLEHLLSSVQEGPSPRAPRFHGMAVTVEGGWVFGRGSG